MTQENIIRAEILSRLRSPKLKRSPSELQVDPHPLERKQVAKELRK